jgi:hypothetical protein
MGKYRSSIIQRLIAAHTRAVFYTLWVGFTDLTADSRMKERGKLDVSETL